MPLRPVTQVRVPRSPAVVWLPLTNADDAALVRAVMQGHPHAPSVIWDRYSKLVRGMLRRMVGPSHEVEDRVQDVFLRLFRQIGSIKDPAALRSFLIGITVHVAGTEIRRQKVRRWLRLSDSGTLPDDAGVCCDDPVARQAVRRLYEQLDRADSRSRMAFVLRHFEGMELTEIAQALGCSLATTKRCLAKVSARMSAVVARDPVLRLYQTESDLGEEP